MKIKCIWEHNRDDTLLYADNMVGAFTRGETKEIALRKMPEEVTAYLRWRDGTAPDSVDLEIVQDRSCDLNVCDADSDVLFESEKEALTLSDYIFLRDLSLKSAADFLSLYHSFPDKNKTTLPFRKSFYGAVPRTAEEMYQHTKSVNAYYFGEIGVDADNEGSILECRKRGFQRLEGQSDFLSNGVTVGSYDEEWSVRKVLRRFIWHDRIHAKAMYRMGIATFGNEVIPDIFRFHS